MELLGSEKAKKGRFRIVLTTSLTALSIVAFTIVIYFTGKPVSNAVDTGLSLPPEPVETVRLDKIIKGNISKNSSLYAELLNLELAQDRVAEITSRFSRMYNLRKSQPGDTFQIFIGPDENIVAFEYTTGDWKRYRLDRDGDKYIESVKDIGLERHIQTAQGKIESNLWDALSPLLPDMEVFFDMADVFGWEIDFLTEPRVGDSFKIVFEVFENDGVFVKTGNILAAEYILNGEPHRAFLYTDPDGYRDYYDENGYSLRKALLKSPLNYRRISSKFSYKRLHPIYKVYRPHLGVDYAAAIGTPIVSAGEGYVLFKGKKRGFGNYLEIKHGNNIITCYGHLGGFAKGVMKGRHVVQGQVIGYVGNTGESTGPHLDYRIRKNNKYVNPLKMTIPAAMPVKEIYKGDFRHTVASLLPVLENHHSEELLAQLN